MESAEIARRFLSYFEEQGHTVVPSASLVSDDPTTLFTIAGMAPFKPYFIGQQKPPYPRATTNQKVVRTADIDEVGKTARHATFFQMLGNFSFGDYFKEKAIPYAWELLTRPRSAGGFGFPEDKLWVTVYLDDEVAAKIWREVVGVPADRIQRRGLKDNYWHMGVPGPGGPCSEIFYDRGPEYGPDGGPAVDESRFVEVWNLVFMQEQLSAVRSKEDFDVEGELPAKNIDTGMGLERMAAVLQGVDNIYEIDTTGAILRRAAELTGHRYGADPEADVRLRVVADHVRSATMLVGDGVLPSNEARGYVLRRILRRSVRNLRQLGADRPLLPEIVAVTIDAMSPTFPDLGRDAARIQAAIEGEETTFLSTLRTGTALLDTAVAETKRGGSSVLSGDRAFTLHDTYGFPIDLTLEMAAEHGLSVDEEGFRRLMAEQRERAKRDAAERKAGATDLSVYHGVLDAAGTSLFTGYGELTSEAKVVGLLVGGASVPAASEGDQVEVVLDRTPLYAEGGGQLADHGVIALGNGAELEVYDVQSPVPGLIVHRAKVRRGEAYVGADAYAEVETERRRAVSRSHSATHMVHAGFRRALGESAAQAGSENSPGRFRFDFTAPGPVSPSVLRDVEDEVNATLAEDLEVHAFVTDPQQARATGAVAIFGEKYGDEVRVIEIGEYSRELCGGTHVARSGQLGAVKLLGESSIGAGIRRVEALVGIDAFRFLATESVLVSQLSDQLKVRREELPERVGAIVARLRASEKELERLRSAEVLAAAAGLAKNPDDVDGVAVVAHRAPDGTAPDDLRRLALDVRGRLPRERPAVVAVVGVPKDRPVVVAAVNEAGRERGLRAGELVGAAAKAFGGGGGGKDDVAQGGGVDAGSVDEALHAVRHLVGRRVGGSG
ncbi:MAG: alanine--tRNA ligase [Streptosporangiales bacterium]|nr:alanine--tRNA ligase [Streptosporangiales bacterium]